MMIASWSWVPASLVVTDASSAASAAGRLMRTTQLAGCWTGWLRAGCSATATPAVVNVTGLPSVRKPTPVGGLGGLIGPAPPGGPSVAPGPVSATEPAGHLLTDAPGSVRPGSRTMADERWVGAGGAVGAGPSGSAWLQPAPVSTRPVRAAAAPTASLIIVGLISAPGSRAARARRSASGPHQGRRSRPRSPE